VSVEATDGRTDPELLAATTGDPDAFGVLYGRYEAPVLRFFLRRGATPELAADLAGQALRGGEVVDFDERTYPKIAENLRCSEMVVPPRARRGLQTVRTRMEEAL
jgi:DNA-directed RNA polymerase specialized sigma24 family protein